ncbi:hypothetical protein ABT187_16265 [Streptomyces sp. NPDC001817]|uniref:hypothetical protein n=1 Tax=Streptomyces sp. NPDC001817 TaxID=3154398 RepID=UPI003324F96E
MAASPRSRRERPAKPALPREGMRRPAQELDTYHLRLIETLMSLLQSGGVPRAQAAWGVDLLPRVPKHCSPAPPRPACPGPSRP